VFKQQVSRYKHNNKEAGKYLEKASTWGFAKIPTAYTGESIKPWFELGLAQLKSPNLILVYLGKK